MNTTDPKRGWDCETLFTICDGAAILVCVLMPLYAGAETQYVGYDEAVIQLRQQLVERQTTAMVYLESDSEMGSLNLWDMMEDALAHTGRP